MKLISVSLLLLTTFSLCSAQRTTYEWTALPQVGATLSSIVETVKSDQFTVQSRKKPGFLIGSSFGIQRDSSWLQGIFGVHYVQRGGELHYRTTSPNWPDRFEEINATYNYLDLSAQFRAFAFQNRPLKVYARAGGIYSIGLGGRYSYSLVSTGISYGRTNDVKFRTWYDPNGSPDNYYIYPRWDLSVVAGLGVSLQDKITVDFGYARSVAKILAARFEDKPNQNMQLSVGMPLHLASVVGARQPFNLESPKMTNIWLMVEAGPLTSRFTGKGLDYRLAAGDHTSYGASVMVKIEYSSYFFYKGGLSFFNKGGEFIPRSGTPEPYSIVIPSVALPILIGLQPFNFNNTQRFNLSVEGGISLNADVSSKDSRTKLARGTFNRGHIAQQLGVNLELIINDRYSFHSNYSAFRNLTSFYKSKDDYDAIMAQGTFATIGLMMKLTK